MFLHHNAAVNHERCNKQIWNTLALRSRGPRQQGVKMKKIKNNNLLKKNSDQKLRLQSHSNERLKLDSDWTQIGLRLDSNWTQIGLKLDSNMVFELFLSFLFFFF